MTITLPKSKMDPFGKGVAILMPATNDPICPRHALKKLLCKYPASADAPLFACHNTHGYKDGFCFHRNWFLNNLRDLLIKAGINPIGYNGHSFRWEAAHSVAAAGMSPEEIQTLGRWKSDSYRLYTGSDNIRRLQLTTKVNRNLCTHAPRAK